ncbi:MAG TPA: pyridoxamine 5'-phosphate oxidase family protein [Spirochaetia bacterium]|nr:pyridoxamine 5'-phosphate oxidase family protein [Spirochaetales bacterium]HRY71596.1 pyridoxamine 5'-phosphate oxidase family protein [Spirochaetia bacterium]
MANYHLRRADREMTDQDEIKGMLREGKYATVAMDGGDGPYLVVLSYGYDEERNALYFHSALKGHKLDCLARSGKVCALVMQDLGYMKTMCEHAYKSLVLRGEMSVVEDLEEKKRGLDVLLRHLEEDPAPILKRNIKDDSSYAKVAILKLAIGSITAKRCLRPED